MSIIYSVLGFITFWAGAIVAAVIAAAIFFKFIVLPLYRRSWLYDAIVYFKNRKYVAKEIAVAQVNPKCYDFRPARKCRAANVKRGGYFSKKNITLLDELLSLDPRNAGH